MFNGLRPPPSAVLIGARRWRVVALVGVLAALLVTVMLSHQSVAAQDEYLLIEARVAAQRHDDGRVEVVLEVRRDGAGWVEQIKPVHRFLPDPAPIGVWWNSTPPVTVPGVPGQFGITARRIEGGHVELGLQRVTGVHWGERLVPRLRRLDTPRYGPDRIHTSSIDLVDEGPARCRLGLILDRGDRCRFPDTRDEFVVEPNGDASYPGGSYEVPGDEQDGTSRPAFRRFQFKVPFLHGIPPRGSFPAVLIERLAHGEYIVLQMGVDRLRPINDADCAPGLLVPAGHYCTLPGGYGWFVVYEQRLAHFTVPEAGLNWLSYGDLEADATPTRALGAFGLDAAREAGGWRIESFQGRTPWAAPPELVDVGACHAGLILERGQRCGDPTTTSTLWVNAQGGWSLNGGRANSRSSGFSISGHPNGHSIVVQALSGERWIIQGIARHGEESTPIGSCSVGLVVYPGEWCWGRGPHVFIVYANGLAHFADVAERDRLEATSSEGWFVEFTAERQSDDGFLITAMR